MPTRRGWTTFAAGLVTWLVARIIGSPDLHMLAAGVTALPWLATALVRFSPSRLEVHRHLSAFRVNPGTRIDVSLTVENLGRLTTSFLLLEDAVPAGLGITARLVVAGIPPRCQQTARYKLICRQRGRYTVGPLTIHLTDPFGLARVRTEAPTRSEVVVFPEIEPLTTSGLVTQGAGQGEAAVRHLHRSAAEFYTMREYVEGDDLRRIHWPSVARTGQLMIRQDESTRRSAATLFLDTRQSALGAYGSAGFERGVSITASLGRALARSGFALRLAMVEQPPRPIGEEALLDVLAGVGPSRARSLAPSLGNLRAASPSESTLALVSAPPLAVEAALLSRIGTTFARKIAVFVYPITLSSASLDVATELEGRATAARASLQRAGWDVYIVHPEGRLSDVWRLKRSGKLQTVATSS
ncbi:MAG TPA: DUF58 domain-containing protein [Actinomycetota bacterium]|nr:DUF58 domain-containing protein [Actinomycetota bacterium]